MQLAHHVRPIGPSDRQRDLPARARFRPGLLRRIAVASPTAIPYSPFQAETTADSRQQGAVPAGCLVCGRDSDRSLVELVHRKRLAIWFNRASCTGKRAAFIPPSRAAEIALPVDQRIAQRKSCAIRPLRRPPSWFRRAGELADQRRRPLAPTSFHCLEAGRHPSEFHRNSIGLKTACIRRTRPARARVDHRDAYPDRPRCANRPSCSRGHHVAVGISPWSALASGSPSVEVVCSTGYNARMVPELEMGEPTLLRRA